MGMVAKGTNHVIRGVDLSSKPSNQLNQLPVTNNVINCALQWNLHRNPEQWDLESFQVGECIFMLEGWHTLIPWIYKLLCLGLFQTLPCVRLKLGFFCIFIASFIINH